MSIDLPNGDSPEMNDPDSIKNEGIKKRNLLKGKLDSENIIESKEKMDSIIQIIIEEFTDFCNEGCSFDTQQEAFLSYEKVMLIIEARINSIDKAVIIGKISTDNLHQALMKIGYHLDISLNPMTFGKDKKYVLFVGLHKVIKEEVVTFRDYLPNEISSTNDSFPDIKVKTVSADLINFERIIKKQLSLKTFFKQGAISHGDIILYKEGIRKESIKIGIMSEEECKKIVLANEIGHIIFGYIFNNYTEKELLKLNFSYKGRSFTFDTLDETCSDIISLNFGTSDKKDFLYLINEVLNRQGLMNSYKFSTYVYSLVLSQVFKEMKIDDGKIPEEKLDSFRSKFLEQVNNIVFGIVKTCLNTLEKDKRG